MPFTTTNGLLSCVAWVQTLSNDVGSIGSHGIAITFTLRPLMGP